MTVQKKKIRYAVVGIGHIAQVAVLPAFRHAKSTSTLQALVTGDASKSNRVARKYVALNPDIDVISYDDYVAYLDRGEVDAVYIATPNHRHTEFVLPALERGIHVLCEKPLALRVEECQLMALMAKKTGARFMVAYRLHFEPATLAAIDILRKKKIGDAKYMSSVFSYSIQDKSNIRLRAGAGGGPLWDIGIYCVNAARALFGAEPVEVCALAHGGSDARFKEVEESLAAVMKFPRGEIATFVCSFGATDAASFEVYGTRGSVKLENAFEYATSRALSVKTRRGSRKTTYKKSDQFAAEIEYFSCCILKHAEPEPNAKEGLADVQVILALQESVRTRRAVRLDALLPKKKHRPRRSQRLVRPPTGKVTEIGVRSPH